VAVVLVPVLVVAVGVVPEAIAHQFLVSRQVVARLPRTRYSHLVLTRSRWALEVPVVRVWLLARRVSIASLALLCQRAEVLALILTSRRVMVVRAVALAGSRLYLAAVEPLGKDLTALKILAREVAIGPVLVVVVPALPRQTLRAKMVEMAEMVFRLQSPELQLPEPVVVGVPVGLEEVGD
jgi:hypothetical protein